MTIELREHETGVDVIEALRSEFNEDIPGMLITGDNRPGSPPRGAGKRLPAAAQTRAERPPCARAVNHLTLGRADRESALKQA
ncbi:MAG: hypothetical protein WDM77_21925 [Steroidobacteraceae bacterium]